MKTVKQFFAWKYSGFFIPCFYGLGVAAWATTRVIDSYELLFSLAAALFVLGFVWSLGWAWAFNFSGRSSSRHSRRYSDTNPNPHSDLEAHEYVKSNTERRRSRPRRRRSNRKPRRFAMFLGSVVFVIAGALLASSFRAEHDLRNRGRIAMYLSDGVAERTRATPVPYRSNPDQSKDMMFALVGVPTREVALAGPGQPVRMNVVIRNIGKIDIHNLDLRIDSNASIKALNEEELSISNTEVDAHLPLLKASLSEHIFPVEITPHPHQHESGLLITIMGDTLRPYAAASKILFIDGTEPSKPTSTAVKEPAH